MKSLSFVFLASIFILNINTAFAGGDCNADSPCNCCTNLLVGLSGTDKDSLLSQMESNVGGYPEVWGENKMREIYSNYAYPLAELWLQAAGKAPDETICGQATYGAYCSEYCSNLYGNCNTAWTAAGTGYQSQTTGTWICHDCFNETTKYRCAAGYWGNPSNNVSGCTKCTSPGTSTAGSTSITRCYVPSGTTGSDSTGTFTYTSKCYWSN